MAKIHLGNIRGPQGEQGERGPEGPQGIQGPAGLRGSMWFVGSGIIGVNSEPKVFADSGLGEVLTNDYYLNMITGNVYRCVVGGEASVATWVYAANLNTLIDTDETLTLENKAADAKITGDAITNVSNEVSSVRDKLNGFNIIRKTLSIGETTLTFENERITENSIFSFYTSIYGVSPDEVTATEGSVTLKFSPQQTDMEVGVRINE